MLNKSNFGIGATHPAATDESLVLAVAGGDMEAFAEIVRRHHSWAWKIAYRFMGNADGAADIVQDAFLRLLTAARRYRPTAGFKTYFYRIISNLCLDEAKKKQPLHLDPAVDLQDPGPNAEERFNQRETETAINTALKRLPANQRIAIDLRYYEGLTYQEIAEILEISPKAVERLLARGREQLRIFIKSGDHFFKK